MGGLERSSGSVTARVGVLAGAVIVQLILGTVYGYSIFWQPLTAEVFPEVITEAEHAARLATGIDPGGVEVVADDAERSGRLTEQQGYLKYAFSICILSFAFVMVIAWKAMTSTTQTAPTNAACAR